MYRRGGLESIRNRVLELEEIGLRRRDVEALVENPVGDKIHGEFEDSVSFCAVT